MVHDFGNDDGLRLRRTDGHEQRRDRNQNETEVIQGTRRPGKYSSARTTKFSRFVNAAIVGGKPAAISGKSTACYPDKEWIMTFLSRPLHARFILRASNHGGLTNEIRQRNNQQLGRSKT